MAIPNVKTLSDADLLHLINDRRISDTERIDLIADWLRRNQALADASPINNRRISDTERIDLISNLVGAGTNRNISDAERVDQIAAWINTQ